jgi:3-oxoacyl-[acyl-carrier-protein] synthase-3
MKEAYIKAISYFLPEQILTNEELVKDFPDWSVEKVASKIGINKRHIVLENETAADLATKAAEKLFTEYAIDHLSIDFVLLCTQSPDYFLPTSACLIQNRLCLSTACGALDFNLGCSGYVYGLSLAKGLIAGGIAANVLLLTAETYTKHLHPKDKSNRAIFGDGASASLISTNGFAKIGNFNLGTDGSGAENLIVKKGGFRQPDAKGDLVFDEGNNPISSDYLFMNGSEILNFTLESVPLLVSDTLAKNALQKKDIDLFVFHQANKYVLNFLRRKIKIDEEKFYYYLENLGNTVSSTIPIALREAMNESKIKIGNKVLIAGFGVGYSWGGVILEF